MSQLHVFADTWGTDKVVAADIDDAWAVWCDETGEKREEYDETMRDGYNVGSMTWEQRADDSPLTITHEDCGHEPEGEKITKSCREWAESEGRGFLCSTEH